MLEYFFAIINQLVNQPIKKQTYIPQTNFSYKVGCDVSALGQNRQTIYHKENIQKQITFRKRFHINIQLKYNFTFPNKRFKTTTGMFSYDIPSWQIFRYQHNWISAYVLSQSIKAELSSDFL